jgi:hypothetical protein
MLGFLYHSLPMEVQEGNEDNSVARKLEEVGEIEVLASRQFQEFEGHMDKDNDS